MAHQLSEAQVAYLREKFSAVDKDGNGRATSTELGTYLKSLGHNATEKEVQDMINSLDTDGSGTVEFSEFLTAAVKRYQNAFSALDKDGNGFITSSELGQAMKGLGIQKTDQEIEEMIKGADVDKDGQIKFEEFVSMSQK
ncbi:calmodulin-like [Ptychodera flava]|uniref:calmodulin-like n=1 Tax=Ptychodera flava TaxID=63121 RepID=UPI003969CF54